MPANKPGDLADKGRDEGLAGSVVMTPSGGFKIIDPSSRRSPVVNDDERLWSVENSKDEELP